MPRQTQASWMGITLPVAEKQVWYFRKLSQRSQKRRNLAKTQQPRYIRKPQRLDGIRSFDFHHFWKAIHHHAADGPIRLAQQIPVARFFPQRLWTGQQKR